MSTNKPGVYVCGAFQAPKDIPQSVMEASAAAAAAGELLNAARGTAIKVPELPPEMDVTGQEPRVGVFVCNCGINIGGVINVPALTEFVATLPGVVLADQNLFTCSADTQDKILEAIKDNKLNRVVVASCSPRTHAPLFMETLQQAGLNPYLFDMANIRDQDSWVHMQRARKGPGKGQGTGADGRGPGHRAGTAGENDLPGNQGRPGDRRRRRRHGSSPVHRRHGLQGLPGGKG